MKNELSFPSEDMARNATRAWTLAKFIKVAMVSSRDALMPDPHKVMPDSAAFKKPDAHIPRPMRALFEDDDNTISFIIPRQSAFAEMFKDVGTRSMQVIFSNGEDGDHISFEGMAVLSEDRGLMESLWDSHADIHFPLGPDDPSAALMRFKPQIAHFWTGGQDLVSFAVQYVTAKMTGEPQTAGRHGIVQAM